MRPELLKGHLDALLLAVLEVGPLQGYAVIESLRTGSDGTLDLPTGTVYPALHRLERDGLVASDWQTVGGRRRRAHHLTRAGRTALHEHRAVWDQFSTAVTALLGRPGTTGTRMKPAPAVPAEARICRYLDQIAAGLYGPRGRRSRILTELQDGLDQAVADHLAAACRRSRRWTP
jgi:PadR family transcriptional regulator PadR